MADYDEFTVKFARLIQKARDMRGKILDDVVFVESILDLIILKYFCESTSKMELFQATLLNQEYISFESKIKTFKNLNLGEKYAKTVKELGADLDKVREKRNGLAHRMIDNSEEAINSGQLRFVYYKGGKKRYQPIEEGSLQNDMNWLQDIKAGLLVLLMHGDFSRTSEIDIKA